jgi:hypothetical protein
MDNQISLVKVSADIVWVPNEMESGLFDLVVIQEEAGADDPEQVSEISYLRVLLLSNSAMAAAFPPLSTGPPSAAPESILSYSSTLS